MFYELVTEMLSAFNTLQRNADEFVLAVSTDAALPIYLPTVDADEITMQRSLAARAMTQLWHEDDVDTLPPAGIVCASAATLAKATELNDAKERFQKAIMAVRNMGKGDKTRVDKLVERALQQEGRRTDELVQAMRSAGIGRLDLLRCYAKVRILPARLKSVRWTWAKTHSSIVSVTREEAKAMAVALTNPVAQRTALGLLQQIPSDERLAWKKRLPNQLRANLVWYEDDNRDTVVRKAVTISGVCLSADAYLPETRWRDNPDVHEDDDTSLPPRSVRGDQEINPEVFIKALGLHRYLS